MERELLFTGGADVGTTMAPLARARQVALSVLVSLLLSLSAGIMVVGVLLVATGVAVALGAGGH